MADTATPVETTEPTPAATEQGADAATQGGDSTVPDRHSAREGARQVAGGYRERFMRALGKGETSAETPSQAGTAVESEPTPAEQPVTEGEPETPAETAETGEGAEAAVETNPETGEHPQWRDSDPSGTYRDEEGKLRHATGPLKGKYASAEKSGEAATLGDEASAEKRPTNAIPEAGAASRLVRIEVSEGHPVREGGVAEFTVPPEQEQGLRALINGTYTRRQQVADLEAKIETLQRDLIRRDAAQAAQEKWRGLPEHQQMVERYEEIRDTVGQEEADAYWRGKSEDLKQLEESEFQERWGGVEAERQAEAGRQWVADAWQRTARLPAEIRSLPDFQRWFQEEVDQFNMKIELGHYDGKLDSLDGMHTEFQQNLAKRIVTEPTASDILRRNIETAKAETAKANQKAAEAAGEKAVEEFKRSAAERRVDSPPNPVAAAGSHRAAENGQTVVDGRPTPPDTSDLSPNELRKHMRGESRSLASKWFPQAR